MSFPPHMSMIPPMPFFPPGAPMMIPPNMPTQPPPPLNGAVKTSESDKKNRLQVPTTVFVGSISERAPDTMIKRMLQNCGSVVNWKRVQGANGKLQAFGFCEYENPESTLRCIRLLNGWQIQDKKLVVKVDAKTKALLDEYKKKKRHELAKKAANDTTAFRFVYEEDENETNSTDAEGKKKSGEEGEIEEEEEHDYIDSETRREDLAIKQSLETIMREYSKEMNQRALEAKEQALREAAAAAATSPPASAPAQPLTPVPPTDSTRRTADETAALDEEEGKRSLITNEIQMFRNRFKDEETKMRNTEKERKDRYERERAVQREKRAAEDAAAAAAAAKEERKSRSSSRDRSPSKRRDRSSPSDDRYRRTHTSNSVRSRNNDRRSSPTRYDRRSPRASYRRSKTKSPVSKSYNDEDDDEAYERRRQEKRLKEKEIRYRERLKAWEQRERRKQSDYEAEKRQELNRLQDEEKEGKRLLAFLEDYNDENDDPKYYKGAIFTRRLKEREREIENDNRDRRYEKDEIEELRQKLLLQNDIDDIEIEIKKRLEKEEELIRKSLADLIRSNDESENEFDHDNERKKTANQSNNNHENMEQSPPPPPPPPPLQAIKSESPDIETKVSPKQTSALGGAPITGTKILSKRKLAVNEAFRDDDDENMNTYQKKSKLSAIPDQQTVPTFQNSPQIKDESVNRTLSTKSTAPVTPTTNANLAQNQEEKRQAVRKLIESIPTKKEDLFTFPIDWSLLDSNLMEKRIKPWVIKKIVEYIGDEESILTDFICQSIMSKKSPETILSDVREVFDDEAEVFVVKMWRLIVYEIEAKRNGLSK